LIWLRIGTGGGFFGVIVKWGIRSLKAGGGGKPGIAISRIFWGDNKGIRELFQILIMQIESIYGNIVPFLMLFGD
jgi:hypothetical protein